jgi:hypothetical protein
MILQSALQETINYYTDGWQRVVWYWIIVIMVIILLYTLHTTIKRFANAPCVTFIATAQRHEEDHTMTPMMEQKIKICDPTPCYYTTSSADIARRLNHGSLGFN